MLNLKHKTALFFLCLLTLVLLSCGASHHIRTDQIYWAGDFTYSQLKDGGGIVGGVSSNVIEMTYTVRTEHNSNFYETLILEMKEAQTIHIMSPEQLLEHIGRQNYFNMMGNFDDEGLVDEGTLQFLADTIPDVQYLLLAYIADEHIIDDEYDEYIKEGGESKVETDYHKTYLLTVEFHIYDLHQAALVWRQIIYNRAEKSDSRTTRSGCVEGCIDSIFQAVLFGEPAKIERKEVLVKIYKKLVKNLEKA